MIQNQQPEHHSNPPFANAAIPSAAVSAERVRGLSLPPISVFVPGKLMLCGEYDVLFGGTSLSCSTTHGMTIVLSPADDANSPVCIASSLWPEEIQILDPYEDYSESPLLDAVVQCFRRFALPFRGLRLAVSSQLDPRHGVGSSSALRLGVATACHLANLWLKNANQHVDISMPRALDTRSGEWDAVRFAYKLQRTAQKKASGYDFVTQFLGGVIAFSPPQQALEASGLPLTTQWPGQVICLDDTLPMATDTLNSVFDIYVGGKGAATGAHIKDCLTYLSAEPSKRELARVTRELDFSLRKTISKVPAEQKLSPGDQIEASGELYRAMGQHRRLFESLPHFPSQVGQSLGALPGLDETWSYKTTGAGGEDALLVAGEKARRLEVEGVLSTLGWYPAPFQFAAVSTSYKVG